MSDPMTRAIDLVAEALWRRSRHPLETPMWEDLEESQPTAAARIRNEAADLIRRAGLIPREDRLDLGLKRALVAGDSLRK